MNSKLKAQNLTRREFLKLSAIGTGSLLLRPQAGGQYQGEFPAAERLGRVNAGVVELRAQPNIDSPSLGVLYEDAVVPWLREVVGTNPYRFNQRWVETPDGYIWAPFVQPVQNQINQPVTSLPESSLGPGMWVETTVPWVEMALENPPARTQSFKALAERGLAPRLYYSQIFWVDQMRTDEQNQVWYRVNERFGNGELLWGRAEAFRPMTAEEMAPISPEVEDKHRPGRCGNSRQRLAPHLAQDGFGPHGRRHQRRRVGSARHWLDDSVCGHRHRHPFHILAQQLWRGYVARLCECAPGRRKIHLPLDPAKCAV
jgi:hypothetical protein